MKDSGPRDSFVFYRSFLDVLNMLKTKAERTKMLYAIVEMGLEDTIPEDLPLEMRMALTQMRATIIGAKNRYEAQKKNGAKGGAPKGNKNAAKKNNPNNLNVNENVNANVNANDNFINTSPGMGPSDEAQPVDDDYDWRDPGDI